MRTYNEYGDYGNGFKLYNEEHSLWSWHETLADASARVAMEQRLYGRTFQIASVLDVEVQAYGARLYENT